MPTVLRMALARAAFQACLRRIWQRIRAPGRIFMEFDEQMERANGRAVELGASHPRAVRARTTAAKGNVVHLSSRLDVGVFAWTPKALKARTRRSLSRSRFTIGFRHSLSKAGCRSLPARAS